MKRMLLTFGAIFFLALPVHAKSEAPPEPEPASASVPPAFETLKSLAGTWKGKAVMMGKKQDVEVTYRVTSGGSAVEEILMPGTPHEMVSVYFLSGEDVMMTHYCAMGNQPRMRLASAKGKRLTFQFVDATGMKSPESPYMGQLVVSQPGKDKLRADWTEFKGSKKSTTRFNFTRTS